MRRLLFLVAVVGLVAAAGCPKEQPSDPSPDIGTGDASPDTSPEDVGDMGDAANSDAAPDAGPPPPIEFAAPGALSTPEGEGSFRFGAATAAAQIEDGLTNSDWYWWTLPEDQGGLGEGDAFVGDAVRGAELAIDDVALMTQANLDAYRFSIAWDRIEPARDAIDQAGLDHYDALLDALVAAGIRPMITVHHFSSPIWVHDFRVDCSDTDPPTDENLCGWQHPDGAELIIEELAEHAALLARTYGDRVDDWCTLNEPVNYLFASYGAGMFPPGERYLLTDFDRFRDVFRNYLRAHVAVYNAIHANDTVDADGDGVAAEVGFSLSVVDWEPARENQPSDDPEDVAAAERIWYIYHHLFPDAVTEGGLDTDFDSEIDEDHPDWAGTLDWLGVQYYFRAGVTADPAFLPVIDATICFGPLDFGSCLPLEDPTKWVPTMGYEYYEPGMYDLLVDIGERYPDLPLVVTEAGIAATVEPRRAENVVRTLEQIQRAIDDGIDVRGYYHWSLIDNFEWAEGYEPKFGLYSVDLQSYERTPTSGATVLGEIAGSRTLSTQQRETYGGTGPMTPPSELPD